MLELQHGHPLTHGHHLAIPLDEDSLGFMEDPNSADGFAQRLAIMLLAHARSTAGGRPQGRAPSSMPAVQNAWRQFVQVVLGDYYLGQRRCVPVDVEPVSAFFSSPTLLECKLRLLNICISRMGTDDEDVFTDPVNEDLLELHSSLRLLADESTPIYVSRTCSKPNAEGSSPKTFAAALVPDSMQLLQEDMESFSMANPRAWIHRPAASATNAAQVNPHLRDR